MIFKAAICPSCGGQLQVPDDRDSVKCVYCGSDIVVRDAVQKYNGANHKNFLGLAEEAIKLSKYQKALDYYTKALELDINNSEAWFGKGMCVGWLSTLDEYYFDEMESSFQNAINFASNNIKETYKSKVVTAINEIVVDLDNKALNLLNSTGNSREWNIYLDISEQNIDELDFAHKICPNDLTTMENIILICIENIEGYKIPNSISVHGINSEYEKELTNKINEFVEKIQIIEPDYIKPEITKHTWLG